MLSEFEKKVARFAEAHELFGSAPKVVLAVSGGADSMALLYVLRALKAEGLFDADLLCAHVNHRLRGQQADSDEAFVVAQAARLNLPAAVKRVDVRGFARQNRLSIETAARQMRIAALMEIAKENHCDLIATAHQKDDNAETILQRLSRGTGFRGLAGIWPSRVFPDAVPFIRPLLSVSRDEILEYLREQNVEWRDDHTNADCNYRRNYIRHRLLPALQRGCAGTVVEVLSELSQHARGLQGLISRQVEQLWLALADCAGGQVTIDLKKFAAQPQAVQIELLRRALTAVGCGEQNLTHRHYESILHLAQQNVTTRQMELPGGFLVRREYERIAMGQAPPCDRADTQAARPIQLKIPGRTKFGGCVIEATIRAADLKSEISDLKIRAAGGAECFDMDKVKLPLHVRFRRAGDRFIPLGMSEEKKLGKFLTDQRILQRVRSELLVVGDSEKIIWAWPIRISEQAKVCADTRTILRLRISRAGENSVDAEPPGQ